MDTRDTPINRLISLAGRRAVVTGAAKGIGASVAMRLAEAGAKVALFDRDGSALSDTVAAIEKQGGIALGTAIDVTDSAMFETEIAGAIERLGGLDIWVNNAGISPRVPALETTNEQWDAVIDLNLRAAFVGARAAGRTMSSAKNGGVIVNMLSSTIHRATGNPMHYRVSKLGLLGLTQSLAVELGRHGIRVVGVAPTLTDTPWVRELQNRGYADGFDKFAKRLPLGRMASPDDVARVVLFACSDLASFVTGTVIDVDGGESCA